MRSKSSRSANLRLGSSFRDPAGFIFTRNGQVFRQINKSGALDFDYFLSSGLYKALLEKGLIVKHQKVSLTEKASPGAYAVIKPQTITFITYPFEWSFTQLKDAALLTLRIQKLAIKHGMSLKDASAYNIQFVGGKPIFIDTLSFEKYKEGEPWQAYRQFCQHFLAPLALMSYTDQSLSQLLRVYIDGVPLELATKLLPRKAKIKPGLLMHLVLHARAQKSRQNVHKRPTKKVSQASLVAIVDNLQRIVKKLKPQRSRTEWGSYYDITNYSARSTETKAKLVKELIRNRKFKTALDLGGNNGRYSRVLNREGIFTICADIDINAVDDNYLFVKRRHEELMLPLVIDLSNPGGPMGWENSEREPVEKRLKTDVVMALALIHHLAISNNLPFEKIAEYFTKFAPYLLIEFVPKEDSQVQKLLSTREDIFPDYNSDGFEQAFKKHYTIIKRSEIKGSKRSLYLLKGKS